MGAHAPAHPAGWTTCADELLQLRQPLEAQGVELQQLRLSKAALFAAAEVTASRNRDTPTAKHCAVSLIQAWLAVHGRFDRFSGVQGTSCLRI